jgi:hypothetical protein
MVGINVNETYTTGALILYLLVEIIKYFISSNKKAEICLLSSENQKKLDDLWDWHNLTDDEGRRLWYVPKHLHLEQEKIVEMLRGISKNQETTARLLGELIKKIEQ